jgi:acyl-CoA thioester hydrolase
MGMSYAALEEQGVYLPLVEAHLNFEGPARYDDLLEISSAADLFGRARLKFEVVICHAATRRPVVSGYTVHAFMDRNGKPIRPPASFVELLQKAAALYCATPEQRV